MRFFPIELCCRFTLDFREHISDFTKCIELRPSCEECGKTAGGMTVFSMLRTLEEVSDGQTTFDLRVRALVLIVTQEYLLTVQGSLVVMTPSGRAKTFTITKRHYLQVTNRA